jgi:GYF domain 2
MKIGIDVEEPPMQKKWLYSRDGRVMLGPCTSKELKQLASTGQLLPTDKVRSESMEKAVMARRIRGLFAPATGPGETGTP